MNVTPEPISILRCHLTAGHRPSVRGILAGVVSACAAAALLHFVPAFEINVLARSAARLTAFFCGSPVLALTQGFAVPGANVPVIVTSDCSAADFFCMVAALVTWQLVQRPLKTWIAIPAGLAAALPLTIFVNGLRILTVAQAHRWFIPLFPEAYAPFLHLTTGVAVFLPSLIVMQLLFEYHAPRHAASPR